MRSLFIRRSCRCSFLDTLISSWIFVESTWHHIFFIFWLILRSSPLVRSSWSWRHQIWQEIILLWFLQKWIICNIILTWSRCLIRIKMKYLYEQFLYLHIPICLFLRLKRVIKICWSHIHIVLKNSSFVNISWNTHLPFSMLNTSLQFPKVIIK